MCILYKGFLLASFLASTILCQMVRAEPKSLQTQNSEVISTSAIDLKVLARRGIGYTTDGADFEGFSYLEGFLPLRQKPGTDITFNRPLAIFVS